MTFAGLPRKEFRKVENIHFLATSNIVPSVPLGRSIVSDLDSEVLVKCPVMCTLADNPRASEFEHHLGSCANRFFTFSRYLPLHMPVDLTRGITKEQSSC